MIISRSPLRISLGGGGTDIPSFYQDHGGGFLVAAAIDKYVFVAVHDNFVDRFLLKYSKIEDVETVDEIEHKIIREGIRLLPPPRGIEVTSIADIPAGTGLGSSGSFAVGLIKSLSHYQGKPKTNLEIAELACKLEIDLLREPVGKQDQYISALGGLLALEFRPDGTVDHRSLDIPWNVRTDLEENLLLFFTGVKRSASEELKDTKSSWGGTADGWVSNLEKVRDLGRSSVEALEAGDLESFAKLLTEQWVLKLERAPTPIHERFDEILKIGLNAGALGGKLVGAGGGGFLLFYARETRKLRKEMARHGFQEVRFAFDDSGSSIL